MSEVKRLQRYSRDFNGNLSKDPNGDWILFGDAAEREGLLTGKIAAQRLRADTAEAELKKLRSDHFKEAVACVFDNLKIVACNTDDRAWDDRLEDLAEDVIEMAPEYKKEWKDIGDLCRKLAAAEQRIASHESTLRHFANCADVRQVGTAAMDYVAALNPNPEAESHE